MILVMMRRCFFLLVVLGWCNVASAQSSMSRYYYFDRPADIWEESIPLGNGRIGMMPWGSVAQDVIVLNEISLWSGNKQDADNPAAYPHLGEIRKLLFDKKHQEAQDLLYATFTCLGEGSAGVDYGNYQNFGKLSVDFAYAEEGEVMDYRRSLDLNRAVSENTFRKGEVSYTRSYFTSFGEDVGVIRYAASHRGALTLKIGLEREERFTSYAQGNEVWIEGQLAAGEGSQGMKFAGVVKVLFEGGTLETGETCVTVTGADEVVLLVSLATDYYGGDERRLAKDKIEECSTSYTELYSSHVKAYCPFFDRMDIQLPKNGNSDLPIDKRLEVFQKDPTDYDLVALYVQYGRYLLISSTREGGLPPNLQGLWAPQLKTPWNGDYHLNINLQMNLWGAEMFNLAELHRPLLAYTQSLVEPGEKTAKVYYNSRGWVTHILGNVWGFTSPGESPVWGATNTANAWLSQHLWEHYVYQPDLEYLRRVYPTMKGAALFFDDMLVEDPNNGYLVTAPTSSPENAFLDAHGAPISITSGSTMDNQIIRELFGNVSRAATLLQIDADFREVLHRKRERLSPTSVGRYGQIMEWLEDYEEAEPHHRHVSHLYGLHPGYEMTYSATPKLMDAARVTLERRGDQSTGWSMAWKINFWARLKDGDRAYKLLRDLLRPAENGHGSYPNLFSAHPPMQIDGNFGGSAGIGEMLLQSHEGYVEVLPSIPQEWQSGMVRGMRVRGGAEVDFKWQNSLVTSIDVRVTANQVFRMKLPSSSFVLVGVEAYKVDEHILTCVVEEGDRISIQFTEHVNAR